VRVGSHLINQPSPQIYNGLDAALTYEINDKLAAIPDDRLVYNFSLALQAPVLEMMARGIRVDPFARETALGIIDDKLARLNTLLTAWLSAVSDAPLPRKNGELTAINSPKQLRTLFYDVMQLPRIRRWDPGAGEATEPMDREVLEKLADHYYARPIAQAVICARDLRKEREVLTKEIDEDWRWRQSINIAGTKTGRFSSSRSTTGSGSNTQNVSADLRHIFVADEGWKLAGIDKEQAESRELGYICGILFNDWSYLDLCEGGDKHTEVCRMVWPNDLPWTGELAKDKKIASERTFYRHYNYRDTVKRLGYGSDYGGMPPTLSHHTNIPVRLCAGFQERYFERLPCIPRYHQWVAQELQTKGYLVNRFGRRRDFFDRVRDREVINSGIADLPQSSTAYDMNLGLLRLWHQLGTRIQLLHQWHDAVYFLYREDDDEQDVMRQACKLLEIRVRAPTTGREFYVPVEPKVGWNFGNRWRQDDDGNIIDANPRGLDKFKWKEKT
jgi:DNA polymerase I-like protein with 3'-5' exonuclease and polymerase domains